MTESVDVAIANFNTREHLHACLASVLPENPRKTVVVDNASSDLSVEMVRTEYPQIALQANKTNLGFGAAANQAIASCSADYVLFLNSDTLLLPGALHGLSAYLNRYPRAAIVGPRLVNGDGTLQPSCYPFPTLLNTLSINTSLARLMRWFPLLRNQHLPAWPHDRARVISWVEGAALAIRRAAFESVGGFDESFFMYLEEVDLCYRLKAAGWQVHFAPVATVVHSGAASTSQHRTEMALQFFGSTLRFCRLHYPRMRSAALTVLMRSIMLARWIADRVRLHLIRDECKSARIAADAAVWQRALTWNWRRAQPAQKAIDRNSRRPNSER